MKDLLYSALVAMILYFNSCQQNTDKTPSHELIKNEDLKLQIYLFHPVKTCETCKSMEYNMEKVLDSLFKEEVKNGLIDFKVITISDSKNKTLVEKYEVKKTSLRFIKIENGVEKDHDLSEFAFNYSNVVPDYFMKAIKDSIDNFISKNPN
ncbi:MAG: nitrophenyl compound nitroreductase subunit ArsF family protein [Bacteroidales bacterium]